MATNDTANKKGQIASLDGPTHDSKSPLQDAVTRLLENRFAVMGLVIILLFILMAIFARQIAPYSYSEQDLSQNNSAPQWVVDLFPIMLPADLTYKYQEMNFISGEMEILYDDIRVQTGDQVQAGDVIAVVEDGENLLADVGGTIFITDERIVVSTKTVPEFAPPEGTEIEAELGTVIDEGTIVYDNVTVPFDGVLYQNEDTGNLYLRSADAGYVRITQDFPLGADALGRDLLSRIIYGSRVSLAVAFVGPVFAMMIGLTMGLIAGYYGGWVDSFIMRVVDVFYGFPTLLLIILLMALFRSDLFATEEMQGTIGGFLYQLDSQIGGMLFIFIGIGFTSWVGLARLTRGQVLSVREQEYIMAAKAMGAGRWKIIRKHVLPNILGPLIVAETLTIPIYIRYEAFLSFIGLGVNPPTPSWGGMISEGAQSISTYPHQAIFPALALFIIMFAFNFLGDGLRDAFDPRMRGVN